MSIISVRDLVVEYDGRRVLDGLNLDIEPGQITVLLGGSGSGKSTLLRQILGLEHPKSGSISIKGTDITTLFTGGFEDTPTVGWGGLSERCFVQFTIAGRQCRAHLAGAHRTRSFNH